MQKVTDAFLDLALNTGYEDIPKNVIHEAKRILLDGIGNSLGGIASDKGKIGVEFCAKGRRYARSHSHRSRRKVFCPCCGIRQCRAAQRT